MDGLLGLLENADFDLEPRLTAAIEQLVQLTKLAKELHPDQADAITESVGQSLYTGIEAPFTPQKGGGDYRYFRQRFFCFDNIWSVLNQRGAIEQHPSDAIALYTLVQIRRPKRILEIGSFHGGTAYLMAAALDYTGLRKSRIVSVDPHMRNMRLEVVEPLQQYIEVLQGSSPEILSQISRQRFGMVHIDANHSKEYVEQDFRGVLPLCESGAVVVFHDANHVGVRDGIAAVVADPPRPLYAVPIFTKTEPGLQWAGQSLVYVE